MLRILLPSTLVAAAVMFSGSLAARGDQPAQPLPVGAVSVGDSQAEYVNGGEGDNCRQRQYGQPDLFYNFYVPPVCGGVPAQAYVAPLPVPPHVGHTYYTYQPLMPHEMLYTHQRTYHRYYDGGRGLTRTRVIWW